MRKALTISGIVFMLLLLVLGPKMVHTNAKNVSNNEASSSTPTSTSDGTSDTTPSATTDTAGTSTFNIQPVTLPNGSISFPTYTVPTPSYSSPGTNSTSTAPDPSMCTSAKAAISQIQASYAAQDQQLQQEIKNLEAYITANTYYAGPGAASPPDTSTEQAQLQADNNQLIANVNQINSQSAPYQQQLTENACG